MNEVNEKKQNYKLPTIIILLVLLLTVSAYFLGRYHGLIQTGFAFSGVFPDVCELLYGNFSNSTCYYGDNNSTNAYKFFDNVILRADDNYIKANIITLGLTGRTLKVYYGD